MKKQIFFQEKLDLVKGGPIEWIYIYVVGYWLLENTSEVAHLFPLNAQLLVGLGALEKITDYRRDTIFRIKGK